MEAVAAEYSGEDGMNAGARALRRAGFASVDAFGPYPLQEFAEAGRVPTWIVPLLAIAAGVIGAAVTYYMQYWMNAVDYPLNVGGRPLHSWPAFIPAAIIVGVLLSGAATLLGMLILCDLPRLNHPAFDIPGFERASQDRFFLLVTRQPGDRDLEAARAALQEGQPVAVHEVAT